MRWGRDAKGAVVWGAPLACLLFLSTGAAPRGNGGGVGHPRLLYSIQKSFLVFPGRNLSPAIDKWRAEGQSCGEREGICPSRLGLVLSPKLASLCYFSLSPANLSQSSFLSPAEDLEIGNPWRVCPAPRRTSPMLRLPFTRHKPVRNLYSSTCATEKAHRGS